MNQKNEIQQTDFKKIPTIWIIVITIIATALIIGGGIYWWQKSVSEKERAQAIEGVKQELEVQINQQRKQIQDLEKEINDLTIKEEPQKQDEKENETTDWMGYENTAAGFSLKYPSDLEFTTIFKLEQSKDLTLTVAVTPINELEDTPVYNKDIALIEKINLEKGEYYSTGGYQNYGELVKLDNKKYAKSFPILGYFDICSIDFKRVLRFYNNDQVIEIELGAIVQKMLDSAPQYFEDYPGCIGFKVFKSGSGMDFFGDLKDNKGSGFAQEWYDTFDDIVKTIEIR